MERFYMTWARSRPNEIAPWAEANQVPLLTNAVHRYSESRDDLLDMWEYDTPHVIDAGGYNVMASYVDRWGNVADDYDGSELMQSEQFYPWTLEQYDDWLARFSHEFEWATVMDYACEERFDSLWSYEDRIEATFENTLRQFSLVEDNRRDYKLLPVLQGREVEEYVDFYERLEDHGIPTDHVGVGTICRLASEKRIVSLEQAIRERIGDTRLHGFGIKLQAYKHGATFESADSQAWVYGASNGKCYVDDGDRLREIPMSDNSMERTVESFKNYYNYVTRIQQGETATDYDSGVTPDMSDEQARQQIIENCNP